jgi:hypothetical protein
VRGDPPQHIDEIRRVTFFGIAPPLMSHNRQRQLGKVFERQVIQLAGLDQAHWGVQVVSPKTTAVSYANGSHEPYPRIKPRVNARMWVINEQQKIRNRLLFLPSIYNQPHLPLLLAANVREVL